MKFSLYTARCSHIPGNQENIANSIPKFILGKALPTYILGSEHNSYSVHLASSEFPSHSMLPKAHH